MIPDSNAKIWKDLVTGKISHKFSSFVFQMEINKLQWQVSNKIVNVETAVKELHSLCSKYDKLVNNDIATILNS